jgi:rhodanese-related sulfurtransferase
MTILINKYIYFPNISRAKVKSILAATLYPAFKEAIIICIAAFIIAVVANWLRPAGIPLLGFSSETFIKQQQADIPLITIPEAYKLYRNKKAVFVDARDPFSFEEGHIVGAINIYPYEVIIHLSKLKAQLSPDSVVITYCDGPKCHLSKETAHSLLEQGIPVVKVLIDGWRLWLNAGYPVAQGTI